MTSSRPNFLPPQIPAHWVLELEHQNFGGSEGYKHLGYNTQHGFPKISTRSWKRRPVVGGWPGSSQPFPWCSLFPCGHPHGAPVWNLGRKGRRQCPPMCRGQAMGRGSKNIINFHPSNIPGRSPLLFYRRETFVVHSVSIVHMPMSHKRQGIDLVFQRHNSYTTKFTLLKCMVQCFFLMFTKLYNNHY